MTIAASIPRHPIWTRIAGFFNRPVSLQDKKTAADVAPRFDSYFDAPSSADVVTRLRTRAYYGG